MIQAMLLNAHWQTMAIVATEFAIQGQKGAAVVKIAGYGEGGMVCTVRRESRELRKARED